MHTPNLDTLTVKYTHEWSENMYRSIKLEAQQLIWIIYTPYTLTIYFAWIKQHIYSYFPRSAP